MTLLSAAQFLGARQKVFDRRGMPPWAASWRAFVHGPELGGDLLQGTVGRCGLDAGDQPDESIVAIQTLSSAEQPGFDDPSSGQPLDRPAQTLDCPGDFLSAVEDPDDLAPRLVPRVHPRYVRWRGRGQGTADDGCDGAAAGLPGGDLTTARCWKPLPRADATALVNGGRGGPDQGPVTHGGRGRCCAASRSARAARHLARAGAVMPGGGGQHLSGRT
jgi:hypothetical protein